MIFWLVSTLAWGLPQAPHDVGSGISCGDCHVPYGGLMGAVTGVASSGSAGSLSDATASWTLDVWVDGAISFTSGANAGQYRIVTASTATTLSWSVPLSAAVGAGDAYSLSKATEADVATRCKSCHNPTGMASSMSDVGMHRISGFEWIGCGKCHEPHNLDPNSGQGASLIRSSLRNGEAQPVTVYPTPGNAFVRGAAPYDGVCESCHTSTLTHQNSAALDHGHNVGQACTNCHEHKNGFTLGCVDCHSLPRDNQDGVPVGGRRAVVSEFATGIPADHAHSDSGLLTDDFCRVCHDMSGHRFGQVRLYDPDGAGVMVFEQWRDLGSDPDVSTFCEGCHDSDGATRLALPLDPFGSGAVPPDVASRFDGSLQWDEEYSDFCFGTGGTLRGVNSHHDIRDADQDFSGAKVECLDCHGSHTPSRFAPLADPLDNTTLWVGSDNAFCLSCHDGGAGPSSPDFPPGVVGPDVPLRGLDSCDYKADPWYMDLKWSNSHHGPGSKRGWAGYSGAPSHDLDCMDCHDPHGSQTASNPVGNPYMIRDQVDGTAFVDDGYRPGSNWTGPPWNTFGVLAAVEVPVSGQTVGWGAPGGLCESCHAGWLSAYSFHSSCNACQNCHGHGQLWGGNDWGPAPDDTPWCP